MDKERIINRIETNFDDYELCFLTEKTKRFETRERNLCGVDLKEETGVALRAIKDNRMIFSYTYDQSDGAAQALLDNAAMLMPITGRMMMSDSPRSLLVIRLLICMTTPASAPTMKKRCQSSLKWKGPYLITISALWPRGIVRSRRKIYG